MRSSLLVLLAACGAPTPSSPLRTAAGVPASSSAPAPPPAATGGTPRPAAAAAPPNADPSLAAAARSVPALLAQPGELFMLVVEHGKPRCEPWTVEPKARLLRATTRVGSRIVARDFRYAIRGDQLEFADFKRHEDFAGLDVEKSFSTCTETYPVREVDGALAVGDARWYRSAADCAGAIRLHARTATKLGCALPAPVPRAAQVATRARFEAILRRGGAMFSITNGPRGPWCQTLTFAPGRAARGDLLGSVSYPVTAGTDRGIESYHYAMDAGSDELSLGGPTWVQADGSVTSKSCAHTEYIELLADHVRLTTALYFTRARCRGELAERVEHDRWFPRPSPEADDRAEAGAEAANAVTVIGTVALGGC